MVPGMNARNTETLLAFGLFCFGKKEGMTGTWERYMPPCIVVDSQEINKIKKSKAHGNKKGRYKCLNQREQPCVALHENFTKSIQKPHKKTVPADEKPRKTKSKNNKKPHIVLLTNHTIRHIINIRVWNCVNF